MEGPSDTSSPCCHAFLEHRGTLRYAEVRCVTQMTEVTFPKNFLIPGIGPKDPTHAPPQEIRNDVRKQS